MSDDVGEREIFCFYVDFPDLIVDMLLTDIYSYVKIK